MAEYTEHCVKCFYNNKKNIGRYGYVPCYLCEEDMEETCFVPDCTDVTKDWKANYDPTDKYLED